MQFAPRAETEGGRTISKGVFDDSSGGLNKPALGIERLAVEPRNKPIGVPHRVSALGIHDQLARA